METIEQAKIHIRQGWETPNGAECPCCGQKVKRYHRKLTATMAAGLIRLVNLYQTKGRPIHVTELNISFSGGEFAQLKRWGLISEQINQDTGKRTSGLWLPTDAGFSFVDGAIKVPAYCDTYNMKTLGFSEDQTSIHEALGKKFSYSELMGFLI